MDRLTGIDSRTGLTTLVGFESVYDSLSVPYALSIENALARLSAYEDTGLSPEEVETTKAALAGMIFAKIKELNSISVKRLIELAKAEAEGRLVVLPRAKKALEEK